MNMKKNVYGFFLVVCLVAAVVSCSEKELSVRSSSALTPDNLVGTWMMIGDCACADKTVGICFFPDGHAYVNNYGEVEYSVVGDSLLLKSIPAAIAFDTASDGTILMSIHTSFNFCGEMVEGMLNYEFAKDTGFVCLVEDITPRDLAGSWTQVKQCECGVYDTLVFDEGTVSQYVWVGGNPLPGNGESIIYTIDENTLNLQRGNDIFSVLSHELTLAKWPNGKATMSMTGNHDVCTINTVLSTMFYEKI